MSTADGENDLQADPSPTSRECEPSPRQPLARKRPKGRARARLTTNPMAVRANGNSARGRRLRDLFQAFMGDHDPEDLVVQSAALRCAELVATSEDIRAEIRDGSTDLSVADRLKLAEQLVRVENLAGRASKQLSALLKERKEGGEMDWAELQRQAEEINAAEDRENRDSR